MMRQTIFENRKRQTSFLAFVFVLNPSLGMDFLVQKIIKFYPDDLYYL